MSGVCPARLTSKRWRTSVMANNAAAMPAAVEQRAAANHDCVPALAIAWAASTCCCGYGARCGLVTGHDRWGWAGKTGVPTEQRFSRPDGNPMVSSLRSGIRPRCRPQSSRVDEIGQKPPPAGPCHAQLPGDDAREAHRQTGREPRVGTGLRRVEEDSGEQRPRPGRSRPGRDGASRPTRVPTRCPWPARDRGDHVPRHTITRPPVERPRHAEQRAPDHADPS